MNCFCSLPPSVRSYLRDWKWTGLEGSGRSSMMIIDENSRNLFVSALFCSDCSPLSHSLTARARPITFLHCSVLWEAINRSDRQTSQSVMRRAWRGRAAVCSGAACAAYDECLLLVTRSEMPDKRDKRDNKSVRATFNFGSSCQWRGNERWPQKKRLRERR